MKRLFSLPLVYALSLGSAPAWVIYESAQLGLWDGGGPLVSASQFLGTRFHLDNSVYVEQIGGAMYSGEGTVFGGIWSLNSLSAFPSGNPFDTSPLAVAVFSPGYAGEFRVPLSVALGPGDYALVFGSGLYGASGWGVAWDNNSALPGASSFWWYGWEGSSTGWYPWVDGVNGGPLRFVIDGVAVPEPGAATLFAVAAVFMALGGSRTSRSNTTSSAAYASPE